MAKLGFDLCDFDRWPLTLTFCMDITFVNGNNSWKFHDTMRGTLWKWCQRQTDGRTSVLHIWHKHQVKLDAPDSAPTYLCSHLLAVIALIFSFHLFQLIVFNTADLLKIPLIFQHHNWSSNNTVDLPIIQSIFQHNNCSSNDIFDLPIIQSIFCYNNTVDLWEA